MAHDRSVRNLIAAALLLAGVAISVFGVAAAPAHADQFSSQPHNWCPGEALPFPGIQWDMGVCHT